MPKLNSMELKHKRKILNWAGENWHSIKEANKTKIFCAVFSKEYPSKIQAEVTGSIDHYFTMQREELDRAEAVILKRAGIGAAITSN